LLRPKKKSFYIYFSIISASSFVIAGLMYFVYGSLRQYYLPASLAIVAAAGILVYYILTRVIEL
jgi:hypothetical protein